MAIYRTTDTGQSDRESHLDSLQIEKDQVHYFLQARTLDSFPSANTAAYRSRPDSSERFLFFIKGERTGESPCKRKKSSFRMTAASFA